MHRGNFSASSRVAHAPMRLERLRDGRRGGARHVDIDFAPQGPRFSTDARVVASGGCCGGFVTDPPSASEVDVPSEGDAGVVADAGGTG